MTKSLCTRSSSYISKERDSPKIKHVCTISTDCQFCCPVLTQLFLPRVHRIRTQIKLPGQSSKSFHPHPVQTSWASFHAHSQLCKVAPADLQPSYFLQGVAMVMVPLQWGEHSQKGRNRSSEWKSTPSRTTCCCCCCYCCCLNHFSLPWRGKAGGFEFESILNNVLGPCLKTNKNTYLV